ncbi:MAG: T9SS type A sorting domain-containing protein [Salinivirgaceae bacterium]
MVEKAVTDFTGKVLVKRKVQSRESIDLSPFPNGIYLVTVQSDLGTARKK